MEPTNQSRAESTLVDRLTTLQAASGGVVKAEIVTLAGTDALFSAAETGNRDAARTLHMVVQAVEQVASSSHSEPVLCGCCSAPVRPKTAFAVCVVTPASDACVGAAGLVICEQCAADQEAWPVKATEALRGLWPNIRAIELQGHTEGHA